MIKNTPTSQSKIFLSIETSCDETSLCILEVSTAVSNEHTFTVLSHKTHSQIAVHKEYGGVFPNLAKREHQAHMIPLLIETLQDAGLLKKECTPLDTETQSAINLLLEREPHLLDKYIHFLSTYTLPTFDAIIVTTGPGLAPALFVGVNFAKAVGVVYNTPLVGVNHMEGHILSVFTRGQKTFTVPSLSEPFLSLLISGGHTELILGKNTGEYQILGRTLDDAVGEAFDKVARLLDLPYPGGPEVSKLAHHARFHNLDSLVTFPRPMLHTNDYNFSFSGLKTAVLYFVKNKVLSPNEKAQVAREFEDSITEVLLKKTLRAINEFEVKILIIGGGVSANTHIRNKFEELCSKKNIKLLLPSFDVTGDNALMIGIPGVLMYLQNKVTPIDELTVDASKTY